MNRYLMLIWPMPPAPPEAGSLWVTREAQLWPHVYEVEKANFDSVAYRLFVDPASRPRRPNQPTELCGLRSFHFLFEPKTP